MAGADANHAASSAARISSIVSWTTLVVRNGIPDTGRR